MKLQPVILSGGSGSRLWPLSRELYPKQLIQLVTEQTMLQDTVSRLTGVDSKENIELLNPVVVCNEEHRFFVAEQLRQIGSPADKIILEPVGRNTAPALTLAALAVANDDPDTVMLVMPADHVIQNTAAFHQAVQNGLELSRAGYLVTFGITPDSPQTGYGYIRKGAAIDPGADNVTDNTCAILIDKFVEKPDMNTAQSYLASGEYLWNSGLFMMKASSWLDEIVRLQPQMHELCKKSFAAGEHDKDFYRVNKEIFSTCPGDSIDYAVMEKITDDNSAKHQAAVIPLDAGWSDVGVWSTLWDVGVKDESGNVIKGDVHTINTRNSLIYSDKRFIASIGMDDVIVVETTDALLVAHKDHAQDVKEVVNKLKSQNREEHLNHRLVYRPWGSYECIDSGERFQVKRITVNRGASLSLQLHHHRAEHWIVVKGTAEVTRGKETFLVTENESTYIPLGVKHRLVNKGSIPLEMIEVQSGSYLGEDDIVRFEDIYGRSLK
ncbi:MAG: mannose-1-phosphate guanylyltransferase/mannose-6-phosphate isomerase [Gammaproteobacteria bacterium]|nr:mannose-1-phosphate guanylyltransferase/mannose-6-phosphate isomerase [Gammaproteobacteria bacterium]